MNSVTPYEVLIAKKVEQLPVPEMADSIWADIEKELDAGSPPDTGSSQPPPGNGLPGTGNGFYLFIVAFVSITLVWIFTGNKNDTAENVKQPGNSHKTVTDSGQLNETPVEKNTPPVQRSFDRNDSGSPGKAIKDGHGDIDSVTNIALPNITDDSVATGTSIVVDPPFDSSAIAPPVRKPRGVKGISPGDYKIKIGNKDSIKKGD